LNKFVFHQKYARSITQLFKNFEDFLQKHDRLSIIIVFFINLCVILFLGISSNQGFYYDSNDYFAKALTFLKDGTFSLLNYQYNLRGYSFPLILLILQYSAKVLSIDEILFFRICFGFLITFYIVILIPAYFTTLTSKKINFFPRLWFSLLVIYFWNGYFLYPLSDFPSLILLTAGLYLILMSTSTSNPPWWVRASGILFAGYFISLSTNIRPSYQIILLPILMYLMYKVLKTTCSWRVRVSTFLAFLFGMSLGYLPQFYINAINFHHPSPFVEAKYAGNNLYLTQIKWGILLQRYETSIDKTFGTPQMEFVDPAGISLMERGGLIDNPIDISKYMTIGFRRIVRLILKYPLDFIFIYSRHLFNGLDLIYDMPYVTNVFRQNFFLRFTNYTLQFITLALLFENLPQLLKKREIIANCTILFLPALLSVPGAIEPRFFLPCQLAMYAVVSFIFLPDLRNYLRRYDPVRVLPFYFIYLFFCFSLSYSVFYNLRTIPL